MPDLNPNEQLWEPDLWTGEGVDDLDLKQQKLWQREMFDQMFPLVQVKLVDRVKTKLDTLRGEPKPIWGPRGRRRPAEKGKRFQAPIEIRAYVEHNPRNAILLKYGFDFPRDVVFTFLDFVLDERDIKLRAGDLVQFEGEEFELTDVRDSTESYWLNTEFNFYAVAPGQRYRTEGNRKIDFGGK